MIIYTDSIHYAEKILQQTAGRCSAVPVQPDVKDTRAHLFDGNHISETHLESARLWEHIFIAESAPRSQHDLLMEINRDRTTLPETVIVTIDTVAGLESRPRVKWVNDITIDDAMFWRTRKT